MHPALHYVPPASHGGLEDARVHPHPPSNTLPAPAGAHSLPFPCNFPTLHQVSRVLPSDTIQIWKKGNRLRMDSTLIDVSEKSLKRGLRSVVITATLNEDNGQPAAYATAPPPLPHRHCI